MYIKKLFFSMSFYKQRLSFTGICSIIIRLIKSFGTVFYS